MSQPQTHRIDNPNTWASALASPRPVLTHLNGDTSWLLQLPYPAATPPPKGRTHFNVLLDPWLKGPQSDVAGWFSTRWHLVPPSVESMSELNALLRQLEGEVAAARDNLRYSNGREEGGAKDEDPGETQVEDREREGEDEKSFIDVVAISHEFTDHCHRATLLELPRRTPVFAPDAAAELIRSWGHFDTVVTTPPFSASSSSWKGVLSVSPLPSWVGIGRVVSAGNALYYHSAVLVAFNLAEAGIPRRSSGEAVLYSPHGINGADLAFLPSSDLSTLALLHGLHDVRLWMTKQLNLGALNGIRAAKESGARYWIATHDEVTAGRGFIAPLLMRTKYSLREAVESEERREKKQAQRVATEKGVERKASYEFVELESGDGLTLR